MSGGAAVLSFLVPTAFQRHLEMLFACRACPRVQGEPVTGAVEGAKVMLVGQAPGPREVVHRRPFAFTAGTKLFSWFAGLGLPEEEFRRRIHIAAVIRCFPGRVAGGDRVPDRDEIARCGSHLDREISILAPRLVIAVGTLAASQFLDNASLSDVVGRLHRVSRAGRRFDLVVLPHPSGRSTWLNAPQNRKVFEESMRLIAEHPAFRKVLSGL